MAAALQGSRFRGTQCRVLRCERLAAALWQRYHKRVMTVQLAHPSEPDNVIVTETGKQLRLCTEHCYVFRICLQQYLDSNLCTNN